ncbi:MAG TPA: D-alanyl-D-alanine carboxypeptidase/D-alanyl-D-alanine-endopeptidase [Myxococcota bacterium]
MLSRALVAITVLASVQALAADAAPAPLPIAPIAAKPAPAKAAPSKGATTTKAPARKEGPARPAPRVLVTSATIDPHLKAQLNEAVNAEGLDGASVSFMAVRLKDGEILAEHGGDSLINPASNAKLITSAAALDALHPEYRFKTEYYATGPVKDGTLYGNLVVKGYGDPSIVSERLERVANELYLYGIERITGNVVVDGSWFDGNEEARGWELEETPDRAYAAPISALEVNYNATAIYVRPTTEGQPAIVRVDPPCEEVVLKGDVMTDKVGRGVQLSSHKDKNDDGHDVTSLLVEGTVGQRESPFRTYRRVYNPLRHFGSVLTYFLQQRGVKMHHSIVEGKVPDGARLVLVDRSPRLTEIVADLNHFSNNIIAETLVKTMGAEVMGAPGTFANGLAVAHKFLEEKVGFERGSYKYDNGSGLNDVNRFTSREIVKLLTYMSRDFETGTEYAASLAVAGTQGTIGFRMRDTPAERHLRAKTGTLHGVSALSGYVAQPGGDVVAFSVLSMGLKQGVSPAWKVQNQIGVALASGGSFHPEGEDPAAGDEGGEPTGPAPTDPTAQKPAESAPGGAP